MAIEAIHELPLGEAVGLMAVTAILLGVLARRGLHVIANSGVTTQASGFNGTEFGKGGYHRSVRTVTLRTVAQQEVARLATIVTFRTLRDHGDTLRGVGNMTA